MDISTYLKLVPAPVALVTGAARSIGYEIALALAKAGALVWLADRDRDKLESTTSALADAGLKVRALIIDVTKADMITAARREVEETCGVLDILVNNAGLALESLPENNEMTGLIPPSQLDPEIFRRTYETNVVGPILMIQSFLPLLRKSKAGRIVNAASLLGSITARTAPDTDLGPFNSLAYASSKSALNAVTVSFGIELLNTPIKVNSSCPGHCQTEMSKFTGPRTAKQGAIAALRLATLPEDGPTCGFFNEEGRLPW
jgi:NAD(P)-dependent dehydrogenase (short-subunit alcohol dehydrogenase family)